MIETEQYNEVCYYSLTNANSSSSISTSQLALLISMRESNAKQANILGCLQQPLS